MGVIINHTKKVWKIFILMLDRGAIRAILAPMTTTQSLIDENTKLSATIAHLEDRLRAIDRNMNALSPAVEQIRQRNESLIAAINYAINEFPSSPSSQYLKTVMENFFQK